MTDEPEAAGEASLAELRRARASGRRVPDFFIVGHPKCGTTALYRMLSGHPQIYMPELKEPHFLARDPRHPSRASKPHPRSLAEYLSLFEATASHQRAGEASTTYLRTPAAARRIAELCPDARIIAIFREPASFLYSLHLQLLQSGIEHEPDFATAIDLEPERRQGRHLPADPFWSLALLYSQQVRYVEQLKRYHELLGRERVLALIYDDFRRDNAATMRTVLRFLEVDDSIDITPAEANRSVQLRSRRADQLVGAVTMGRGPVALAAKIALTTVLPERLRRGALQTVRRANADEPPPPDQRLMAELRRRFKPEVIATSEYLERDLVGLWGYDEIH
jgi:hypothetical protein